MPLLLVLLACSAGSSDPAGPPALTLISPVDGATVCGQPFIVVTDVENFTLTNDVIEDAPPDVGHLHVYLNGEEVAQSDVETVELSKIADAEYQLTVDLALADHTSPDPYVGTTIYITVDSAVCGAT